MGFLRERDFSRDQPCETRLLARLESRMVSWEKFAEVVGTRRVSGERHVLYLTSYVRTEQVWSRMSRETGLARRDHGLAVSSRVSSRKVSQRDATLEKSPKFKLHEIEKDLNESILSRKRENHTEKLGGGIWRI